jgi:hypothetical protein
MPGCPVRRERLHAFDNNNVDPPCDGASMAGSCYQKDNRGEKFRSVSRMDEGRAGEGAAGTEGESLAQSMSAIMRWMPEAAP